MCSPCINSEVMTSTPVAEVSVPLSLFSFCPSFSLLPPPARPPSLFCPLHLCLCALVLPQHTQTQHLFLLWRGDQQGRWLITEALFSALWAWCCLVTPQLSSALFGLLSKASPPFVPRLKPLPVGSAATTVIKLPCL